MKYILFTLISILPKTISYMVCPDTANAYGRSDCSYLGITQNEYIEKGGHFWKIKKTE